MIKAQLTLYLDKSEPIMYNVDIDELQLDQDTMPLNGIKTEGGYWFAKGEYIEYAPVYGSKRISLKGRIMDK